MAEPVTPAVEAILSEIITADHFDGNHFDGNDHSMRTLWGDNLPVTIKSGYDLSLVMFPTQS